MNQGKWNANLSIGGVPVIINEDLPPMTLEISYGRYDQFLAAVQAVADAGFLAAVQAVAEQSAYVSTEEERGDWKLNGF